MKHEPFIHQYRVGPWENFQYLIGDRESRRCAIVDPAWDLDVILAELERLDVQLEAILCTHSHFDHVDQVEGLLAKFDVPVYMSRAEIDFSGFHCENLRAQRGGDRIQVGGGVDIEIMHTPGHTPGSICFRIGESLVTGDTLFVNGCGRCDFVGGDPEVMFATLRKLVEQLPATTVMFPGHDYGDTPTDTLDAQLESNPYLQLKNVADFVTHRMQGKTPNTTLPKP